MPGGAALDHTADKATALLRSIRPLTATDSCRRDLAREMLADLRHLDRRLHTNQAQIRQALAETHSTITDIRGVGHIIASKVLGHFVLGRFGRPARCRGVSTREPMPRSAA